MDVLRVEIHEAYLIASLDLMLDHFHSGAEVHTTAIDQPDEGVYF